MSAKLKDDFCVCSHFPAFTQCLFRKQPCPFCLVFLVVHWNEQFLVLHPVQWIVYLIPMLSGFLVGITGVTIHKLTQCCVCNTHSIHTCTTHTICTYKTQYTHMHNMHRICTQNTVYTCAQHTQYIQYTGMHNTHSIYTHMHNTVYPNICTTYTVYAQLTQFTHLHDTHSVHTWYTHMHNTHSVHTGTAHSVHTCTKPTVCTMHTVTP